MYSIHTKTKEVTCIGSKKYSGVKEREEDWKPKDKMSRSNTIAEKGTCGIYNKIKNDNIRRFMLKTHTQKNMEHTHC